MEEGRKLNLWPDGRAHLTGRLPMKDRTVEGAWNFDETSKRYIVKFNEESTAYAVASLEHLTICMLVKALFERHPAEFRHPRANPEFSKWNAPRIQGTCISDCDWFN